MSNLVFIEHHGYIIDTSKTEAINLDKLARFKKEIENELSPYIDRINACNGKVDITINQDGNSFSYRLINLPNDLYAQIIDELKLL